MAVITRFYSSREKKKEGEKVIFRGGHFEDDTLFHVRLKDREGPNGERILFIEEIQSDWASKYNAQDNRDFEERVRNATNMVNEELDKIKNYYFEGKSRAKHLAQLKTYLNDLKAKQDKIAEAANKSEEILERNTEKIIERLNALKESDSRYEIFPIGENFIIRTRNNIQEFKDAVSEMLFEAEDYLSEIIDELEAYNDNFDPNNQDNEFLPGM